MAYCMPCNKRATKREGVGPTGDKEWMILVDTCYRCGRHYPIKSDELTHEQKSWVTRWNNRCSSKPEAVHVVPDTSGGVFQ